VGADVVEDGLGEELLAGGGLCGRRLKMLTNLISNLISNMGSADFDMESRKKVEWGDLASGIVDQIGPELNFGVGRDLSWIGFQAQPRRKRFPETRNPLFGPLTGA